MNTLFAFLCICRAIAPHKNQNNFLRHIRFRSLQDLLEGTVNGRAHVVALVEVDGSKGALADALGGELEFLRKVSIKHPKKEWK